MKTPMRIVGIIGWLLVGLPSARARTPDRPLDEVLRAGKDSQKPIVLEFSAVWCEPCHELEKELDSPAVQEALQGFVFQMYDSERGEGVAAAERFHVEGLPTVVVLDSDGGEVVRQSGFGKGRFLPWLQSAQADATSSLAQLQAAAAARPGDIQAIENLAKRQLDRHDEGGAAATLKKIEEADHSPERHVAANAAWRRAKIESKQSAKESVRRTLEDFGRRYPAQMYLVAPWLAAAGADTVDVATAFTSAMDNCKPRPADAPAPAALPTTRKEPGCEINRLIYEALAAGAFDAALVAAQRQVAEDPKSANACDTLAEVYNYKGNTDLAVETAKKGLALGPSDKLAESMRKNLERFATGAPSPHVAPKTLAAFLGFEEARPMRMPTTPDFAAQMFFSHQSTAIAAACKDAAGSLPEAYVRVSLLKGPAIGAVEVLEPSAPTKLKRCLEKQIKGTALPSGSEPATVVFPVRLAVKDSAASTMMIVQ